MLEDVKQNLKQDVKHEIAPLVNGLIDDVQTLFRQELKLVRTEVSQDLKVAKEAAIEFGLGTALASLAMLLLALTLVHLLAWMAPSIPLWGCYGIITLLFGAGAAFAISKGADTVDKADFVPRETIRSMKENAQWVKGKL